MNNEITNEIGYGVTKNHNEHKKYFRVVISYDITVSQMSSNMELVKMLYTI